MIAAPAPLRAWSEQLAMDSQCPRSSSLRAERANARPKRSAEHRLASRLVGVAPADTVLADDRFAEAIADNPALAIEPHGHQRLKGLGSVHASRLRPARIS
jgi:hypothetical protein